MESSSRREGTFDIFHGVLKVLRDWRREFKELRLAIPIFEGRDVPGWMIKMGKYFDAGGVCKEDQIPQVVKWMNGEVLTWYQLWVLANPIATWGNFTEAILKQFGQEIGSLENQEPRLVMKSRKVSRKQTMVGKQIAKKRKLTLIKMDMGLN
jgi:hypothetical protein